MSLKRKILTGITSGLALVALSSFAIAPLRRNAKTIKSRNVKRGNAAAKASATVFVAADAVAAVSDCTGSDNSI